MKIIVIRGLISIIRVYQRCISVFFPARCRFYPTCSDYFCQSLEKWGPWKGLWKGVVRISKCHPFNPGGYDPV